MAKQKQYDKEFLAVPEGEVLKNRKLAVPEINVEKNTFEIKEVEIPIDEFPAVDFEEILD